MVFQSSDFSNRRLRHFEKWYSDRRISQTHDLWSLRKPGLTAPFLKHTTFGLWENLASLLRFSNSSPLKCLIHRLFERPPDVLMNADALPGSGPFLLTIEKQAPYGACLLWCAIRDLNPYGLPLEPKSSASASSANRAWQREYSSRFLAESQCIAGFWPDEYMCEIKKLSWLSS